MTCDRTIKFYKTEPDGRATFRMHTEKRATALSSWFWEQWRLAAAGCVCPEHVMLRRIINQPGTCDSGDVVVLDMEAGLEHLGRGTTEGMDEFVVVIETWMQEVFRLTRNVKRLANELGVKQVTCGRQ